ncbi:MAG: response regulator [Deltaproteobacteria bacterium]|nr:response regulator [Deltaproteobacteria bacterium]
MDEGVKVNATAAATPVAPEPVSRRLLIVDDEESVLRALKRALRRQGWQIDVAGSGEAGLGMLAQGAVQVVVSDYKMPGMTGVEFLRAVKERYPTTQRIMLTGYADQQAIEEAINRSEVFRFISKPWDDQQLQLTIASAFEQYDLQEENRRLLALTLQQNEELTALAHSLEKKVAERTALLAKAKDEWEATFDAIERPIAILRRDMTVVRANKAYAAVAGRTCDEVPGHACHKLLFDSDEPCGGCPVGRGERPTSFVELLCRDRSYQVNFFDAGPSGDRLVCIYRETTEEHALTRRMLQTEKLAAVGQLAAGVAHEINNPLGGILAFTQLMQRDPGRAKSDLETLRDIEHAALRCKRIVESLLKFSRRAPQGKLVFDVNKAVEDAVVLFKAQLKSKPKAHLRQEISAEPLRIEGDANQIEQVVLNLLVNALQALKAGEGTVGVCTCVAEDGAVEIKVEDDGMGILPEVRARLFEPAFTTKPPGEGTGFGLAISWSIAESHGGSIEVDSEAGRGSVFTLRLPLAAGR